MKREHSKNVNLFRPILSKIFPKAWILSLLLLDIHLIIRFGGLWNALFIPLSMVILWPLPWLLCDKESRRIFRFKSPVSWNWLIYGPVLSLISLGICVVLAWVIFGTSGENWFVQHALSLNESLSKVPANNSFEMKFWVVTIPAMIFSPLGEEFLYRGFLLKTFETEWNFRVGMIIQASAFATAHLAHYGLLPFQPLLLLVWLPSMFFAALVLGWIVKKSKSIWVGVLSHLFFNLGMNLVVFLILPNQVGV